MLSLSRTLVQTVSLTVYDFICLRCCLPANGQDKDSTPALGEGILRPAVEVCLKLP